jgi:hypothetical protein
VALISALRYTIILREGTDVCCVQTVHSSDCLGDLRYEKGSLKATDPASEPSCKNSKSVVREDVRVRVPPRAQLFNP